MTEEQLKKVEDLFDKKEILDGAEKSIGYCLKNYEKFKSYNDTSRFSCIRIGSVDLRDILNVDEYSDVLNYIAKVVTKADKNIYTECNSYILSKKVND